MSVLRQRSAQNRRRAFVGVADPRGGAVFCAPLAGRGGFPSPRAAVHTGGGYWPRRDGGSDPHQQISKQKREKLNKKIQKGG